MFTMTAIFSSFVFSVLAEEAKLNSSTFSPQFKPHMLDHIHEGCPTNSSCLPQTGKHYKQWIDLLKKKSFRGTRPWMKIDRFRQKNGIPLEIWSFPLGEKTEGLIHWDGPCANHNQKGHKIQMALGLAKNFAELEQLEKKGKIHIPRAFMLTASDTIKEYFVPRGSTPLYLDGDALAYIKETEGVYYGLKIRPQGKLAILPPKQAQHQAQSVECPKKLNERFARHARPQMLYQGSYCRSFWNQKSKIYQTMIFGWTCN